MPKIKNRKLKIKKKGFSLIEAVLSVSVVAVGLIATINLIVSSLNHSLNSRDHIIASQLAQEGVELVRNLRDNNWADPDISDSFDNNNFSAVDDDKCRIDKDSTFINEGACDNGVNHKKLYYKNGFYVHDNIGTVTNTKFQRKIELDFDNPPGADNLIVTSIVVWGRDNGDFPAVCDANNKCVYTQSILTGWGE